MAIDLPLPLNHSFAINFPSITNQTTWALCPVKTVISMGIHLVIPCPLTESKGSLLLIAYTGKTNYVRMADPSPC